MDTSTCSSALPGAGNWTSNLPITSQPALPAELLRPDFLELSKKLANTGATNSIVNMGFDVIDKLKLFAKQLELQHGKTCQFKQQQDIISTSPTHTVFLTAPCFAKHQISVKTESGLTAWLHVNKRFIHEWVTPSPYNQFIDEQTYP